MVGLVELRIEADQRILRRRLKRVLQAAGDHGAACLKHASLGDGLLGDRRDIALRRRSPCLDRLLRLLTLDSLRRPLLIEHGLRR